MQKNNVAGNSLDADERKPVTIRVLNLKAWGIQGRNPGGVKPPVIFFLEIF